MINLQIQFQVLVEQEVAGVGRDASACHDLRSFPEAKEALVLVKNLCDIQRSQSSSTCLHVGLLEIKSYMLSGKLDGENCEFFLFASE